MQLLCPACHTPLPGVPPADAEAVLTCGACSAEVDVSRAGTAAGRPRFVPEIDRTGDTLGSYRLEARVGAGGMGTVYRARSGEGAAVAVKFMSPALAAEPDVVARFRREVKMLESLEHPSIVQVLDHGEHQGVPWFAMELVEGTDLRTRLASGPLGVEEAGAVFVPLLDALSHAHARGVVHRDLKPANVLLCPGGAKLADFGIARLDLEAAASVTRLTETAAILGTFPYMSPEQRAGQNVDRRSDLFSVGVMLYEAFTGKLPQGAFALPSRKNPALPVKLDGVISTLLQPDPADRFPSALDARVALADALRPRPSMMPVFVGGGLVLALLAVVVLPVLDGGRGTQIGAPSKNLGTVASAPTATPETLPTAEPAQVDENAQAVLGSIAKDTGIENLPGAQIGKATTPAPSPAPSATPAVVLLGPPSNRAETNYIAAVENQALAPDAEIVPMRTTCNPTIVYDDPNRGSKPIGKLPSGRNVERIKRYTRLASLWSTGGAGRGAGLLLEAASASSAPASSSYSQKEKSAPKAASATPKEEVWLMIRAEKLTGWIEERCAADVPAEPTRKGGLNLKDEPPPQQQKSPSKSSKSRQ